MRIIKPSWLSHSGEQKDFEVYSCHVSPDGARLATAGGDGHVRIWSTDAILNSTDARRPRQLCHISHHLGTIHSVRFSPNGRYLASGADDKFICVYHLDKSTPAATFGSNEPPPIENWKTYRRLVGHDNDVQDIAWSPDSSLLVSVGLDSKIVIWSGHTFEKLKTLAVHQSHVKGITFDPASKYFATASDDRTIKIIRYTSPAPNATQHDMANNFVLETTISTPFRSSPLTTYFRRCSWSPDGLHIACANGVNGPVNTCAIINRNGWESDINLVGHEGPTEVAMFSPSLYRMKPSSSNGEPTGPLVTVIACAGQDKTLSIWNTNASRPLVIVQDMASKSIADISWAPDGQGLYMCSLDGSVVAVQFEPGELGWVAMPEEIDRMLSRFGASRKGMGLAEDIEGLQLEGQSKAGESRAAESRMGALMGDAAPTKGSSTPVANGSGNGNGNGNGKAKDKDKDKDSHKSGPVVASNGGAESEIPPQKDGENSDLQAERVKELKARVTVGKDGRKRVAPLLVSSSGTGLSSLPQAQLVGSTTMSKATQNEAPTTVLDLSKPYDGLPKGGIASLLIGNKRRALATESDDEDETRERSIVGPGVVPIVANTADGGSEPAPVTPSVVYTSPPTYMRNAITHPSTAVATVRLGVPKVRTHIVRPLEKGILQGDGSIEDASKMPENVIIEARNPEQHKDPSSITVTKRGTPLWQDFVPRAVLLVTGNKFFWAAGCEDGTIHVWSPAGRRLLNPIILESQPVILESNGHWLLCVTGVGMCYVWDMRTQRAAHPPVSASPILEIATTALNMHHPTPGPGITSASLTSTGHMVLTLTNGDGFFYHRDMHTWQRVSEAWWAVGSQYWNSNDSSISALQSSAVGPSSSSASGTPVHAGIIPHLERHTTSEFLLRGRAYSLQRIIKTVLARDGFENFESTVSIAHLENRIAAALQLGSSDEFRLYLFMYAKRIGSEGLGGKVEELLAWLVGGLFEEDKNSQKETETGKGWFGTDESVCGWERKDLLKGVVMILGKYRELQRLVVQHARLLDMSTDADHVMDIEA